jgi:hypothetical protein
METCSSETSVDLQRAWLYNPEYVTLLIRFLERELEYSEKAYHLLTYFFMYERNTPVTVAERSKACTVFARSEAGFVGSDLFPVRYELNSYIPYLRMYRPRACIGRSTIFRQKL